MKTIEVQRRKLNLGEFQKRKAVESDFETLIREPVRVAENGFLRVVYDSLPVSPKLKSAAESVAFPKSSYRTNGLKVNSRGFGFTTRNIIRGDFCAASSLSRENPGAHEVISLAAPLVEDVYRQSNPTLFSDHYSQATKLIDPAYWLKGTIFTSGNLNKNNPILYHFDKGNVPDVWSGMIVLKSGCSGGYLSCPEFGIGFELADATVLLFDGQGLLHGVTPFELKPGGYRYTIVYFTLQQAWKCLPPSDELKRIKQQKTKRENAVIGRNFYAGAKPELSKLTKQRNS